MTTAGDLYHFIDAFAPFASAMDFDNVGLLVGDMEQPVERVLLALDITSEVIKEAEKQKAQLILSHHPVIFRPVKRLGTRDIPYQLVQKGIAALCAHTNLDMAPDGVNDCLAEQLGVKNCSSLKVYSSRPYYKITVFVPADATAAVRSAMTAAGAGEYDGYTGCSFTVRGTGAFTPGEGSHPAIGTTGAYTEVQEDRVEMICVPEHLDRVLAAMRQAHPYEVPAYDVFENHALTKVLPEGLVGELDSSYKPENFASYVKERLGCQGVKYVPGNRPVKRVALCGGAGSDLLPDAFREGADALVTSEPKHHELLMAAESGITLIDASHFCTEDVVLLPLMKKLRQAFPGVTFEKSKVHTDPACYLK